MTTSLQEPADTAAADHPPPPPIRWQHDADPAAAPRIRLMCSFGGRILPRPHDNQLRYVGGDTRIVAVHRNCSYSLLLSKLSKFTATADITVKYQLPNEDLDALISVTSDEDIDNMMEEYDRLLGHGGSSGSNHGQTPRLRLFLFPADDSSGGFGSILSGTGSSKHDHWFLDALNGGRTLERGRSEASSIVSEVPDYLFGLDNNSDELPIKLKNNVSASDPGSPAPVVSEPHYGSASSVASISAAVVNSVPAEIRPEMVEPQPVWQYVHEPVPVYYMPGPVQGGSMPSTIRPVPVQMPNYGQIPVGYRPVYVGQQPVGRPTMMGGYSYQAGPEAGYEVPAMRNNPGTVPMYRPSTMGMVPPGAGDSPAVTGSDMRIARGSQN